MNQRRSVALVAGAATFLASSVFSTVFELFGWVMESFLSIAVVVGVAMIARTLRVPVWGQLLAMLAGLLMLITWTFPSGHEVLGFIPDGHTFSHFHALWREAGKDVKELSIPVPEPAGLSFLVAVGMGLVAIAVDLLAVGLRQPALAGLPLLALYSVPVAINTGSVSWLPFVLGGAGYLWLLMTDHVDQVRRWGRRFTGDGRDIDAWEPSPLASAGRRLGLLGLVLAIALPAAVPGLSSGLLDRIAAYNNGTGSGPGNGSRLGTSINPITTLRGSLTEGDPINLFQLRTDDPDPGYLRTAVADQISDRGFSPGPVRRSRPLANGPDQPNVAVSSTARHGYRAQIEAQQLDDRYLPLFGAPTSIQAPRGVTWRYDPDTGVVSTDRPATRNAIWQLSYDRFDYRPADLRRAPRLDTGDPAVHDNTKVRTIGSISTQVGRLVRGKTTEYDRVRAILDFFAPSNGFKYSLSTKAGTSGSAIVDFLTKRQGYCEQYASAMTWMVRQAHIPARVVVGYTHGSKVGNSSLYQVTSHEAHAWVEVYFPTFGWVPFDPTPGGDVTGSASFSWAPNPAAASGGNGSNAAQQNKPRDPGAGNSADKAQHGAGSVNNSAGQRAHAPTRWPYWLVGTLLALIAIAAIPAARRELVRSRRSRVAARTPSVDASISTEPQLTRDGEGIGHAPARRAAHAVWDELMDTVVDHRIDEDLTRTPRATAARLAGLPGIGTDASSALQLLGHAEERARYAPQPVDPAQLRVASRQAQDALRTQVTRGRRLLAVLLPLSVLRRWRTGIVETAAGSVAGVGLWRQRVLQSRVPRRLFASRSERL